MIRRTTRLALVLAATALFWFGPAEAYDKPITGHAAFGVSLPEGAHGEFLEDGWALHGGATWWSADRPFGLRLDIGLDWTDMTNEALDLIEISPDVPGDEHPDQGDVRIWSGSLDIVWQPKRNGTVNFYLLGGGGVYYTSWALSEVGYGYGTWCDWYWGICYPGIYEGLYLLEDDSSWDLGLNAGAGVTFQLRSGTELYLEATYHWVDSERSAEFVPVTFGARW